LNFHGYCTTPKAKRGIGLGGSQLFTRTRGFCEALLSRQKGVLHRGVKGQPSEWEGRGHGQHMEVVMGG